MRLSFDAGTLVLLEPPDCELEDLPGVVFDARVGLYRAPASAHSALKQALRERGIAFRDEVAESVALPGSFEPVALRPYQRAALLAWELAERRGVVVLPTGSGKTRVALAAIETLRARTLCLVPTRVLVHQWVKALGELYSSPVGIWGDGQKELAPITVATFEGAYRSMHELGRHFELVIVDEVHHFGATARDAALEMCVAPHRLGLTATLPNELARFRLESLVGEVVYELGIGDLAGTFLSDYEVIVLPVSLGPDERLRYAAERRAFTLFYKAFQRTRPDASFQEFVLAAAQTNEGREALASWRRSRRLISLTAAKSRRVGSLLDRHRDNKTLIFTSDNAAAYAIAREHLVAPITCEIGRREREALLDAFREGKLRALVSARVLNEGIDVPDADVAIVVGGTQGEREHVQRVGRLLRPRDGKCATVYELVTVATSEARAARDRRAGLAAAQLARR
jgi:superfamily II DNA or RNA helicase